ncbi:hypothetical protein B0H17DRAFT_1190865 [Mycena rosella]|uniref:Uncharacterized protein n=1 Tax=Mycena rosella TaxID=1033263 RepID=A0AAD7MBT1_MYCRO|nr:hypothetical protein B0H17DRAFT_1190865 [Mycena rosella]
MPTPAHESATHNLAVILGVLMARQLPGDTWQSFAFGGAQTTDISNSGGDGIKEPDQFIHPERPDGPDCCWPNVVIETGVAETHTQLKNDMHRWFAAERPVKFVILIIIDIRQGDQSTILVELYENDPNFEPRPVRQQAVHKTREARRRDHFFLTGDLTGKQFKILWTDLFDKVPANLVGSQPDGLVMDTQDLQHWRDKILTAIRVGRRA